MGTQLLAHHSISDVIAFGGRGDKSKLDLLRDAGRIAQGLPEATADSGVELVFQGDRYLFAAALLGALYRGHAVHLPPSHERDVVMAVVQAARPVAVLHDTTVGAPIRVDLLLSEEAEPPSEQVEGPIAGLVHFHSEDGRRDSRTWNSLVDEARAVARFLELGPGGSVICTLPPSRSLGLVVSVLAPLLSGATLSRPLYPKTSQLKALVQESRRPTLLTTSRKLESLFAQGVDLSGTSNVLLARTSDRRGFDALSHVESAVRLTEVVTSPSFGLLGQRDVRQTEAFQPLPGMQVGIEQGHRVTVDAKFLEQPLHTGRAARALGKDDAFIDLGPVSELIATGKVLTPLSELVEGLLALDGIADAAACYVPATDGQGARVLAACVADPGLQAAAASALGVALAGHACQGDVLCVEQLPLSSDGTCKPESVLRLFGLGASGRPPNYRVDWLDATPLGEPGQFLFRAHMPADSAYFDGHFSGYPILPAAAQLSALVVPAVRRAASDVGRLKKMSRMKFLGRVRPGDTIALAVHRRGAEPHFAFELRRGTRLCAVGVLEFEKQA